MPEPRADRRANEITDVIGLAATICHELRAALAAGEDPRRGHERLRLRLRRLLNATDGVPDPAASARRTVLRAIGRSEIGDQLRRCGS